MKTFEADEDGRGTARRGVKSDPGAVTHFDINQLELAFINRALEGSGGEGMPRFVEIGRSERILRIQKRNLEALCRKNGRAHGAGALESELKGIVSGLKALSARCFPPKHDS
jgi:hypothetical protein